MKDSDKLKPQNDAKNAEEALRKSEARYRSYLEVTGQIGWTTPPDGVVDDMPEWRKFTGQSPEEVKGWGWLNAMHPDDRKRTTEVWNKAVATKSLYETEYRIRRKDGVYRYFLARGIPSLREDGTIREWVGVCIDITERKRAEEERQVIYERFSGFFNSSKDGIVFTTMEGLLKEINDAYCKIAGYSREELLAGKKYQDITPKEYHEFEAGQVAELLKSGEPVEYEKEYIRKDGSRVPIGLTVFIVKGPEGSPMGLAAIVKDLRERKKQEEELERYRKHLEELVEQRTKELNEKIKDLQKFNEFAVDRELVMAELKKKIETLEKRLAEKSKER
jgi:PAS domain S-box-containing protein